MQLVASLIADPGVVSWIPDCGFRCFYSYEKILSLYPYQPVGRIKI